MKIIGLFCVFLVVLYAGWEWSKSYERRVVFLQDFIESLQLMDAEMNYAEAHLITICQLVQQRSSFPIDLFFQTIMEGLEEREQPFHLIWRRALQQSIPSTYLTKADRTIVNQLGKSIGAHPYDQQRQYLQWTITQLDRQLQEAMLEKNKYSVLIKMMSVLIGLLCIVLFI